MKYITTSKGTFLFVPVPDDIVGLYISGGSTGETTGNGEFLCLQKAQAKRSYIQLPQPGKYIFLFTTDNVSENDSKKVVTDFNLVEDGKINKYFIDYSSPYNTRTNPFVNAKSSFQSLLKANNITGNNAVLLKEDQKPKEE